MQIAIARDYFLAYARLPRKVQNKADVFLRKLLADSTPAAIHYESMQSAQDKQLRSVRIGDDYSAIIRIPERQDVILLLWIDIHDQAYQWATSKCTQIHPATGTLQLFDTDAVARALLSLSAVDQRGSAGQTGLFAKYSDNDLFQVGVPKVLIRAVRAVASEQDFDQLAPHVPPEAAEMLNGLVAGFSLDGLFEDILDRSMVKMSNAELAVDPMDVAAAIERPSTQQQFRKVDADFNLEKARAYPLDVWRLFLHPKQRMIARSRTKGPMRVTGAAGTGKTVVALHRVAFLVREVFTRPDDRVLFTTYTANLALDLKRQLRKLIEPNELARVDVRNIDGFAWDYLRKRGEYVRLATDEMQEQVWQRVMKASGVSGFSKTFCEAEWRDVVQAQDLRDEESYLRAERVSRGLSLGRRERSQLWPLFQAYRQEFEGIGYSEPATILRRVREYIEAEGGAGRYRAVVVDETQDFSLEALRLVRALAGPKHPDDLFLVGDARQRIYGKPVALGNAGIQVRGRDAQTLRRNHRTAAAIGRWSLGALGNEQFDDLDKGIANRQEYVSLREGRPPSVHSFEHAADEVAFVVGEVKVLLATGHPPESICITARTIDPLRDRFVDALMQEGIAADLFDRAEPRHSSVRLATMHRVNGLEFPIVFVVGVNAGEVPLPNSGITSDDSVVAHRAEVAERCLLYVAANRARDALYVTSFGVPSPFLVGMGPPPVVAELRQISGIVLETLDEPDQIEVPQRAPVMGMLLVSLHLPIRMLTWAEQKGIATLEELLRWRPRDLLAEYGLGRKTIFVTRRIVEANIGCKWEETFRPVAEPCAVTVAEPTDEGFSSNDWDVVRRNLPSALAETNMTEIDLPVRILGYAKQQNLVTVADIATRSKAKLLRERNLGRRSITALVDSLHAHIVRVAEVRRITEESFLGSLEALLQDHDSVRRMVFTRRAGLGGKSETLKAIGETLGVSRERVRQIENDVIVDMKREQYWIAAIRRRVDEVLQNDRDAAALDELQKDAWWASIAVLPAALDYFGKVFLNDDVRVIEIYERSYLVRCTLSAFEAAWEALRTEASKVHIPAPLETFRLLVETFVPKVGRLLSGVLVHRLREILYTEEHEGQTRVVGFGFTRTAEILMLLRASPTPMRIEDMTERIGTSHIPEEVLFFDAGVVGLKRHFPDFDRWQEKLVPRAIEVMQQDLAERQWLANEILAKIRESTEVPGSLNPWHLASLLRRSGRVRYLGRNRFVLLESGRRQIRIHYYDELIRILRDHGEPMSRKALIEELNKKTVVSKGALGMYLGRLPFIACDADRVGLYDRDLPGGAEAMAVFLKHIEQVLEQREYGIGAPKVKTEGAQLSEVHASWSQEMFMSALRGDLRFRLSKSGGVGLSHWEAVRIPSRADIVRGCLEEADGCVAVEEVQRRLEGYYGVALDRFAIGGMANRFGAVLNGDRLERMVSRRKAWY